MVDPKTGRTYDGSQCTCSHFPIAHDNGGCTLCDCAAAWVGKKRSAKRTKERFRY